MRTLMDFRYKRKYEAENGQDGMKKKRYGKNGEDLIIKVPVGTVVIDEESGLVMKDLKKHGESFGRTCFLDFLKLQFPEYSLLFRKDQLHL